MAQKDIYCQEHVSYLQRQRLLRYVMRNNNKKVVFFLSNAHAQQITNNAFLSTNKLYSLIIILIHHYLFGATLRVLKHKDNMRCSGFNFWLIKYA